MILARIATCHRPCELHKPHATNTMMCWVEANAMMSCSCKTDLNWFGQSVCLICPSARQHHACITTTTTANNQQSTNNNQQPTMHNKHQTRQPMPKTSSQGSSQRSNQVGATRALGSDATNNTTATMTTTTNNQLSAIKIKQARPSIQHSTINTHQSTINNHNSATNTKNKHKTIIHQWRAIQQPFNNRWWMVRPPGTVKKDVLANQTTEQPNSTTTNNQTTKQPNNQPLTHKQRTKQATNKQTKHTSNQTTKHRRTKTIKQPTHPNNQPPTK